MADPFIGWKSLVDCAKNNSLMLIGLYSQKARKNISEIRRKINDLNIKTTRANIINFRKEMFENENPEWNSVQFSPDFYSTSGVRDLLFHIQEHTFTIPQIKDYLKSLKLVFLGFESTYVIEKYKKMYDQPQDLYDLDKWEVFENNNPRIFSGMYQFWCKRN
tara:strand:- start:77 stop:562 length:486 start_codon:yes stop_codon:yes gene_type:complete